MKRSWAFLGGLGVLGSLVAVQFVGCSGGSKPVNAKPNVLILVWDTTRADHLSLYGYPKPTTPNLEEFAKEATVYERATPTGMWTLPTHTSMFTGLTDTEAGVHSAWLWLDNHHETLSELLGAAGYETFAFSANLIVGPWTNLTQGFEHLYTSYPASRGQTINQDRRWVKSAKAATSAKLIPTDASVEISPQFKGSMADHWGKSVFKDAAPVAREALDAFLDERPVKTRPFFAYINMMEAHSPRVPSMESRQALSSPEEIELQLKTDSSLYALNEYIVGERKYTEAELAAITSIYDAAIRDLDKATAEVIASLKRREILDDTVVVILADHGEALGEHQLFEHRWSVYEQLLHVPLIIRYPAKFKAERIPNRVSTTDLYATITDLTGVKGATNTSTSLVGRTTYSPYVFSQLLDPFANQLKSMSEAFPTKDLDDWRRTYCVAYQDSWKLVYASEGGHRLVDLAKDPGETTNLYESDTAKREELEKALYDFESKLPPYDRAKRDRIEQIRQKVLDRRKAKAQARAESGDDETSAMLESMGYAAPDSSDVPWLDFCGPYGKRNLTAAEGAGEADPPSPDPEVPGTDPAPAPAVP